MISLIRQQPDLRHCVIKDDRLTKITEDETAERENICFGLFIHFGYVKASDNPQKKRHNSKKFILGLIATRPATIKRAIRVFILKTSRSCYMSIRCHKKVKLCWRIKLPNPPNFLVFILKDFTLLQLHAKLSAIILCYSKT